MSFTDPRILLKKHRLTAKKRFSQNFLICEHVVDGIVAGLQPQDKEHIVEIGPGLGTLTGSLLARTKRITAIEQDQEMCRVLVSEYGTSLSLVKGDAAKIDLSQWGDIAVAGNLPYAITGAIVRQVVAHADVISRCVLMIQAEVRDRWVAPPGIKAYGAPTVFLNARFEVSPLFDVDAECFHPAPRVQSAVVHLRKRETPLAIPGPELSEVVKASFSGRRKTLRKALANALGKPLAEKILDESGIDGKRRGETLSVSEFDLIATALKQVRR